MVLPRTKWYGKERHAPIAGQGSARLAEAAVEGSAQRTAGVNGGVSTQVKVNDLRRPCTTGNVLIAGRSLYLTATGQENIVATIVISRKGSGTEKHVV